VSIHSPLLALAMPWGRGRRTRHEIPMARQRVAQDGTENFGPTSAPSLHGGAELTLGHTLWPWRSSTGSDRDPTVGLDAQRVVHWTTAAPDWSRDRS
jgi:hypothetical protein